MEKTIYDVLAEGAFYYWAGKFRAIATEMPDAILIALAALISISIVLSFAFNFRIPFMGSRKDASGR